LLFVFSGITNIDKCYVGDIFTKCRWQQNFAVSANLNTLDYTVEWSIQHLFDCKPWLIMFFFHHFVQLTIKRGVHFFTLSKGVDVFHWLHFVNQILFLPSILCSIMRTLSQEWLWWTEGSCSGV